MADGTASRIENEINTTNDINEANQLNEITEILQRITENEGEPSSPFIINIHSLYRAPKTELINQLRQFDPKLINNLRDQLYHIFLDHFSDETLKNNGFIITDSPINHLKRRAKPLNAVYDINSMGLSILEDKVVLKLSSEIFKHSNQQQQTAGSTVYQNVIDSNSKELLLKINELISIVNTVNKENRELKSLVLSLERKIDKQIIPAAAERRVEQQPQRQQSYANVAAEAPNSLLMKHHNNHLSSSRSSLIATNRLQPVRQTTSSFITSNDTDTSENPNKEQPSATILTPHQKSSPNQTSKIDTKSAETNRHFSQLKQTPIYGKRQSSSNIAGQSKPFSLFVGGLNIALKTDDVWDIIEKDVGLKIVNLQLNRTNSYNKSY